MNIPTIALTGENVKPGTKSWVSATEKVKAAMEEYGFFVAIHDLFTSEVSAKFAKEMRDLFDLPVEVKKKNVSDISPFYGYLGPKPSMPLYESLGIFDASKDDEVIRSFTNLMWPSGNQNFCEILCYLMKKLSEMDEIVSKMIYESYGLKKYHESFVRSLVHLLRLNIYRYNDDGSNVGCVPHTDKCSITILHQHQVNGLRVKTKGGKWIIVDLPPSSLIVMAGDSLSAWSNGRIHAPVHQVITREKEERYTLAIFSFYKGIIKVPEQLVDDEHPLLYKPFDPKGLLQFYLTEEGQKAQDFLKAYCGV